MTSDFSQDQIQLMADSQDPEERRKACILLFNRGKEEWCLTLAGRLAAEDDAQVRYYANKALTAICKRMGLSVADHRMGLLKDENQENTATPSAEPEARIQSTEAAPPDELSQSFEKALNSGDTLALSLAIKAARDSSETERAHLANHLLKLLRGNPKTPLFGLGLKGMAVLDSDLILSWAPELLSSKSSRLRADVTEALSITNRPEAISLLLPLLQDPDPRTRANAALAVNSQNPLKALECLREMVSEDSDASRESGLWALNRAAPEDIQQILEHRLLNEPAQHIRKRALAYLIRLLGSKARQRLRELCQEAKGSDLEEFVTSAMQELSGDADSQDLPIQEPDASPKPAETPQEEAPAFRLVSQLETQERALPLDAALLLDQELSASKGADYFDNLISELTDALKSSDSRIRAEAAEGFRRINSEKAVAALNRALKDPDNMVRSHARRALEQIRKQDGTGFGGSIIRKLRSIEASHLVGALLFLALAAGLSLLLNLGSGSDSGGVTEKAEKGRKLAPLLKSGQAFTMQARIVSVNAKEGVATLNIGGRLYSAAENKDIIYGLARGEELMISGRAIDIQPSGSGSVRIDKILGAGAKAGSKAPAGKGAGADAMAAAGADAEKTEGTGNTGENSSKDK